MPVRLVQATPSAYAYPLLIKQLLLTPLATVPDQEITYQGKVRYSYRTLRERIGRLASALTDLGVEAGQTVAMMDWDSHRYLEAFFAVPMMGAILQTVNVRLSPEQILYTLNHAGADVLAKNEGGYTALMMVKQKFYVDVINLLHEAEQLAGLGEGSCGSKNAPDANVITFLKRPAH